MGKTAIKEEGTLRREWGQRVGKLRERLGMSRAEFAEALDVSASTVRRYEAGEIWPGGATLVAMIEMAKKIGRVWEFAGASLPEIYKAIMPQLVPQRGVLVYLDIELSAPAHFVELLQLLLDHRAELHRYGTPGWYGSIARAFVLMNLESTSAMDKLLERLERMPHVEKFTVQHMSKEPIERRFERTE